MSHRYIKLYNEMSHTIMSDHFVFITVLLVITVYHHLIVRLHKHIY